MKHTRNHLSCLAAAIALGAGAASAQITVTPNTVASDLADALFDFGGIGCLTPAAVLLAQTSGTSMSSGTFTVGLGSPYGMTTTRGIVLSTGDVADYSSGPNNSPFQTFVYGGSGAPATAGQTALLDALPGVANGSWFDTTELDLTLTVPAPLAGGRLVFDVVFTTEEFFTQMHDDAFGLYFNNVNIGLWADKPLHPFHPYSWLYPETEADSAIRRLPGGGTAVLTITTPPLVFGVNTLTFLLGDLGEPTMDTTVFISMHNDDCNSNLAADYCDIADGTSLDENANGIPDECEPSIEVETFCVCDGAPIGGPCMNNVPVGVIAGCVNSTMQGATLSVSGGLLPCPTTVTFTITNTPPTAFGVLAMSASPYVSGPPFYDGRLCIKGPYERLFMANSVGGTASGSPTVTTSGGNINCGDTKYFQYWYRDSNGPCGLHANLSNAVKVSF